MTDTCNWPPGTRVVIRRWIQPTLKAGDPDRKSKSSHKGTVTAVDHVGRLVLDSCKDPIYPEPQFLGGIPQYGTARWLVTEVTIEGEPCKHGGEESGP